MFKQLSNLASMISQAQQISGKMQEMKEKLAQLRVTGAAGGGMVTVEMNGQSQLLKCQIDPAIFQKGDREMLEDLVVAAVNQAADKVKEAATSEMSHLAGGVPGLGDALAGLGLGKPE